MSAGDTLLTGSGLMIFAGIVLHGLCYDFFFVTGQIYTEKRADPGLRGQAQGFLVLMTQGVGLLAGALLFGELVEAYSAGEGTAVTRDWPAIWLWPCATAAVILVAFCLLFRDRLPARDRAALAGDDAPGGTVAADPAGGSAA